MEEEKLDVSLGSGESGHVQGNVLTTIKNEPGGDTKSEKLPSKKKKDPFPHRCTFCRKACQGPRALREHERIHTGERPYKCDICPKAYYGSSQLENHKTIHTGVKPYKCDQCPKSFRTSKSLNDHKYKHSGTISFRCRYCDMTFGSSKSRKIHESNHTGDKPYKCDQCLKAFAVKCQLREHKKTHSSEKPFVCEACSKAFRTSHLLKSHMNTHRKKEPQTLIFQDSRNTDLSNIKYPIPRLPISTQQATSTYQSMRSTHQSDNAMLLLFKCDFCKGLFASIPLLKDHEKLHDRNELTSLNEDGGTVQQLEDNCNCDSPIVLEDKCSDCGKLLVAKLDACQIKQEPEETVFVDLKHPVKLEGFVGNQDGLCSNTPEFSFVSVEGSGGHVLSTDSPAMKVKEEIIEDNLPGTLLPGF